METITKERKLSFKPLTELHIPLLNEIRNECAEDYLHDSRRFTLEESLEWFKTTKPDYWAIILNDQMIGYFRISNHSKQNENLYIGCDLHKGWRGKGLGYQAYLQFVPFLFETYGLHKISLEVLATNIRALNLYKRLGFKVEGTKREEVLKKGMYLDSIIMSMLYTEWLNKTGHNAQGEKEEVKVS